MITKPKTDLYDRIINRINREEKLKILKRRLVLEFAGLLLSFFVFVPVIMKLYSDIAVSGLKQYFSLLFTDFSVVMANLGDYVLTLLESTPILSLALALAAMLAIIFYIAKIEDAYIDFKKLFIKSVP